MKSGKILLFAAITALLAACASPKDVVYMQNAAEISNQQISNYQDVKIKSDDLLSIMVSSKSPKASAIFNLVSTDYQIGATGARVGQSRTIGYLVDKEGNIDFPILGRLKVAGMTRSELSMMLKNKLAEDEMLKDAVVTVQFQNFKISVLGEVNKPGQYSIETDRVSILDAVAMAGDLTIYGVRDSVMVVRENDGKNVVMFANLLDKSLLNSPAFYLQQNDVVYVKPNKIKAQQSGINQNNNVSVWLSVASVLTSISVLLFK
ncbi:MAG: polysaccharide biosynthesis/export family protein [Candidatus Egerieousia sp.]